jgi:hypothetical protein
MTEKKHTPSPWEHPELYEKFVEENPPGEKRGKTLKEYLELHLSAVGFLIDEQGDNIKLWARGRDPNKEYAIIAPSGDQYVLQSAVGPFNAKKKRELMKSTLAILCAQFKAEKQTS